MNAQRIVLRPTGSKPIDFDGHRLAESDGTELAILNGPYWKIGVYGRRSREKYYVSMELFTFSTKSCAYAQVREFDSTAEATMFLQTYTLESAPQFSLTERELCKINDAFHGQLMLGKLLSDFAQNVAEYRRSVTPMPGVASIS